VTEAEARARIELFLDPQTEPIIYAAELDILLDISRRVDRSGVRPSDTGWEETYDVNYAVAQGWLVKSTRLAPRYLFMDAGKMYSRNQFYDHCVALHKKFLMRCGIQAVPLVPDERLTTSLIENNAYAPYYR
jgi:hypothetical protein